MLYHGTSHKFTDDIIDVGLTPRGNREGNWRAEYQQSSNSKFVYLTYESANAMFYAMRSCVVNGDDEGVIFKFDTKDIGYDNLYPDENHFITKPIDGWKHTKEMVAEAQEKMEENKSQWKDCLKTRGLVCYKGSLKADKKVVIHNRKNPFRFLQGKDVFDFDCRFSAFLAEQLEFCKKPIDLRRLINMFNNGKASFTYSDTIKVKNLKDMV